MIKVIESVRDANDNEFFFRQHENIGNSDEFQRLIDYVNSNSDLKIVRSNTKSLEQLRGSTMGASYNWVIIKK